ncbi:MAG: GntR family transcriptional regulator, partial [Litoreibacter sp.]|nr:GntR family transcriptional regulator [Litoreibacter sp.]
MSDSPRLRKTKLYEQLKRDILSLQLPPGHDLDEASLSEQFGLSRTPLREVLLQLVGEGYAEQHKNRGCRVAEMSHTSLRNFFLAAPMVYGAVLQLAAQNATSLQIARLKEAQMQFRAALKSGSAAERSLANNAFHMVTGEMADNAYLQPSFQRLLIDHARIGVTFYRPQSAEMTENLSKASAQHDAIIESIEVSVLVKLVLATIFASL